ncbi:MAG: hypothetical protein ACYCSF_12880 [Acidimicrobiales bacterium]
MSDVVAAIPWYKKKRFLVSGVLALIVAVTVVTDLPQPASRGVQVAGDKSVLSSVNASVRSCAYAVKESFGIYHDEQVDSLTPSETAQVPGLLRDDQDACSFTSEDIFNLSNLEVPGSVAGKYLERLVGTVTTWATSDGLAAIEAIQTLSSHPGNKKARIALAVAERRLSSDRIIAFTDVQAANRVLRTRLPVLGLPSEPSPS